MPSARVHVPTSSLAGFLFSLHDARREPPQAQVVEGIAGAIGGALGGKAPDQLDPPTSPNHRARAHGAALGASLLALRPRLGELACWLREQARGWDEQAALCSVDSLDRLACQVIALLCRALAGLLNGFYAGYICHLGLDLFTPAGIPVV